MTHDELLIHLMVLKPEETVETRAVKLNNAIRAVVELHKSTAWYGDGLVCSHCFELNYERTGLYMEYEFFKYPCKTIQTIEKELQ